MLDCIQAHGSCANLEFNKSLHAYPSVGKGCQSYFPGSGTAVGTTSSGQACQLWKTNPNLGTKGKTTMEHKEAIISLECGCAAGTSILSVDFTWSRASSGQGCVRTPAAKNWGAGYSSQVSATVQPAQLRNSRLETQNTRTHKHTARFLREHKNSISSTTGAEQGWWML